MRKNLLKPPHLAQWIIRKVANPVDRDQIIGDYEEEYNDIAERKGLAGAKMFYWTLALISLPSLIKNSTLWSFTMFKNYLKIALRNLRRQKIYSLINISGLAVGMAVFIIISLYIQYEMSFDKYQENYDSIYRVINYQPDKKYMNSDYFAFTQGPLAEELKKRYPEVTAAARLVMYNNILISYKENSFLEDNCCYADPEIFDIFSYKLMKGNPRTALSHLNSVIISERMVKKYFGSEDPVGKIILYQNSRELTVSGVFKNIPENSHLKTEFFVSFQTYIDMRSYYRPERWNPGWFCITYCLLKKGANPDELEKKLVSLSEEVYKINHIKSKLVLQPLKKIHLFSNINQEISDNGDIKFVYLFTSVAFIILMIACINYMNLATARAVHRGKEVGVRKIIGAQKNQLIKQFIGESLVFTFLAFILSILLVFIFLPVFNSFFKRELSFNPGDNFQFLTFLFILIIFTGIISGSYPAFFISSFKPVSALRGGFKTVSGKKVLRNILVVSQFIVSVFLIISTFVINKQLKFIREKDVGFSKDQKVVITLRDRTARNNSETIRTELLKNPDILKVSSSGCLPNSITSFQSNWPVDHDVNKVTVYVGHVGYDFTSLFDIDIIDGRGFSREFPSDNNRAILINETALKATGLKSPIGKEIAHYGSPGDAKIIGIVKDFNFHSLHNKIKPMYLILSSSSSYYISVKVRGNNIPATINFLKEQMKRFSPQYPFEYYFFDEVFDRSYRTEQRMENIFRTFASITIIIACLGLFGLAVFTVENRTKEIGIRKVLGASASNIFGLISREFFKLILIANIIAWPAAWFLMNRWLENFEFRMNLGIGIFLLSAVFALVITLLTIGFQTYKAAAANPVNSLRNE